MLDVAVIGLGIGKFHARSVERNGHNLAAIVGRDQSKGEVYRRIVNGQLNQDYTGPIFYNVEDLSGLVQAAIVASPNEDHSDMCNRLLSSGIHVMVEKPMVSHNLYTTEGDIKLASDLIRLAKNKDIIFTTNLQCTALAHIYKERVSEVNPDEFIVEISTGGQPTWKGVGHDLLSHAISLKMALYGDGEILIESFPICGKNKYEVEYHYLVGCNKIRINYILRTNSEKKFEFGSRGTMLQRYDKTNPYRQFFKIKNEEEELEKDPLDTSNKRFFDTVENKSKLLVDATTALRNLEMQHILLSTKTQYQS